MERLLAAEQKAIDYKPVDDGNAPDHRPTNACTKSVTNFSLFHDGVSFLSKTWVPGFLDEILYHCFYSVLYFQIFEGSFAEIGHELKYIFSPELLHIWSTCWKQPMERWKA